MLNIINIRFLGVFCVASKENPQLNLYELIGFTVKKLYNSLKLYYSNHTYIYNTILNNIQESYEKLGSNFIKSSLKSYFIKNFEKFENHELEQKILNTFLELMLKEEFDLYKFLYHIDHICTKYILHDNDLLITSDNCIYSRMIILFKDNFYSYEKNYLIDQNIISVINNAITVIIKDFTQSNFIYTPYPDLNERFAILSDFGFILSNNNTLLFNDKIDYNVSEIITNKCI